MQAKNNLLKEENKSIKTRMQEIRLELAKMKHLFFSEGFESPMSVRTGLKLEYQQLKNKAIAIGAEKTKYEMMVKQKRAEILSEKLIALGFPNLLEQCMNQAKCFVDSEIKNYTNEN